jgi:GntR family transcriptional repressor for pyruvate dehydrogenase complex
MTEKTQLGPLGVPDVGREALPEQVARHLQELIVAKRLRPGDYLPNERQLGEQFGVSRTVIREACKTLANRGMLRIQAGRGTVVTLPSPDNLALAIRLYAEAHGTTIEDLLAVRKALEPEMAMEAATHATSGDLQVMGKAIEEMSKAMSDPSSYLRADDVFHRAIAEATGNQLFVTLYIALKDLLKAAREAFFGAPAAAQRAQYWHEQVFRQISSRDGDAARLAMAEHLKQIEEAVQIVLGSGQTVGVPPTA